MVGELIMLPVRVGVRVTRLWFRAVEESVSLSSAAAGRLIELAASRSAHQPDAHAQTPRAAARSAPADVQADAQPEPPARRPPAPVPSAPRQARRARPDAGRPATDGAPTESSEAEPAHVSEEPMLVEAFAEPGAEDGAGAQVHVAAPWDGYERMGAKQVISRLANAGPAELAAVELYERTNRRRQTILNAVERALRNANGSGARGQQRG